MTSRSSVPARLCVAGGLIGVAGGLVTAFVPPEVADSRYSYPYTPRAFVVAQLVFMLNPALARDASGAPAPRRLLAVGEATS